MASQNLQAWVHWVFINERLQLETSSQRLLAWNRWICLTRDHCLRRHFNIYKRETTGHLNKRPPSATAFQHLWEWHRWIFERETTWDGIVTFVSMKPLDPLNEAPLFKPFSSEFLSVKPLDVLNERALFEQHFNNFKRGTTGYIEWDTSVSTFVSVKPPWLLRHLDTLRPCSWQHNTGKPKHDLVLNLTNCFFGAWTWPGCTHSAVTTWNCFKISVVVCRNVRYGNWVAKCC